MYVYSLGEAIFGTRGIAIPVLDNEDPEKERQRIVEEVVDAYSRRLERYGRTTLMLPFGTFALGLSCFGIAVLANLL